VRVRPVSKPGQKKALTGRRIAECMMAHPLASYRVVGELLAAEDGRKMRYTSETIGNVFRAWQKQNDSDMPRGVS
jgi:hypothetical protein